MARPPPLLPASLPLSTRSCSSLTCSGYSWVPVAFRGDELEVVLVSSPNRRPLRTGVAERTRGLDPGLPGGCEDGRGVVGAASCLVSASWMKRRRRGEFAGEALAPAQAPTPIRGWRGGSGRGPPVISSRTRSCRGDTGRAAAGCGCEGGCGAARYGDALAGPSRAGVAPVECRLADASPTAGAAAVEDAAASRSQRTAESANPIASSIWRSDSSGGSSMRDFSASLRR